MFDLKRFIWFILSLVGLGVLLGFLGPVGTYDSMSTINRYIYWIVIMCLNGLQAQVAILIAGKMLPQSKWPSSVPVIVGSIICSLLATFEIYGLEDVLNSSRIKYSMVFAEVYIITLVITLVVSFLFTFGPLRRYSFIPFSRSEEESNLHKYKDVEIFFDRLSTGLGRELICLKMEDHYLRVYTMLGDELLLMRMRDAVVELKNYDGMQVHRSFWVSRKAIKHTRLSGARPMLIMNNDMEIPVSRNRLKDLQD